MPGSDFKPEWVAQADADSVVLDLGSVDTVVPEISWINQGHPQPEARADAVAIEAAEQDSPASVLEAEHRTGKDFQAVTLQSMQLQERCALGLCMTNAMMHEFSKNLGLRVTITLGSPCQLQQYMTAGIPC